MNILLRTIAIVASLIAITMASTTAQPVLRSLVVSNGIIAAENDNTEAYGTIGQAAIGPSTDSRLNVLLGFWSVVLPYSTSTQIDHGIFLSRIAPNPVDGSATLTLILKRDGYLQVGLYDMLGRREIEVASGQHSAGEQRFTLETYDLAPGMRLLVISFNGRQTSIPVQVLR